MLVDKDINEIDKKISRHIAGCIKNQRGEMSQDILKSLRDLVEHVLCRYFEEHVGIDERYDYNSHYCCMMDYAKTKAKFVDLLKFHRMLQIASSHYTLSEEASERLMLHYYKYLLLIKNMMQNDSGLVILKNLSDFPLNLDNTTREYHEQIANCIDSSSLKKCGSKRVIYGRYYIHNVVPFFVAGKIYYEVTFVPAIDNASKFDRCIGFSKIDITDYYASKMWIQEKTITIAGKAMPVMIILDWAVSIRPCEIDKMASIAVVRGDKIYQGETAELGRLNSYLTKFRLGLGDIMLRSCSDFENWLAALSNGCGNNVVSKLLRECYIKINGETPGHNVLRYLLLRLNNKIIRSQMGDSNNKLSGLCLSNGCIPFDKMPFARSLINHNPRWIDIARSISMEGREHELLVRRIKNNTERDGCIFTRDVDLSEFSDLDALMERYNSNLYIGHVERSKIVHENGLVFINEYKDDVISILDRLKELATTEVVNLNSSIRSWVDSGSYSIDCVQKKEILKSMFDGASLAMIYGAAGTGKTMLVSHIASFFSDRRKLFVAVTNSAVNNLRRRIKVDNSMFSTLASVRDEECDILFVDECSTVSNTDMLSLLGKVKFKVLVLVGDIYQIEAIRFGNWFGVAKNILASNVIFELYNPYRTTDSKLLSLWSKVRAMEDIGLRECLAKNGYSRCLDQSFFECKGSGDEIVLCLGYDGLYGINNINRFLQASNPNPEVILGINKYKKGDPVLFNEANNFGPAIYNNLKGRIIDIKLSDDLLSASFVVEVDAALSALDESGFRILPGGEDSKTLIEFVVKNDNTGDQDNEFSENIVPFQLAYAISIHKAQGLEYDSVKVVIDGRVDERITHDIFYTAITRARNELKIFWTPEVENKILGNIKPKRFDRDASILKQCFGVVL